MSSPRILVADASPLVRERLVSALVSQLPDARIKEASTRAGALEGISSFDPDVLLLNPKLPGDSVVEFIGTAIGLSSSGCRVVVLAWESSDFAARCVAAGAHGVVDKADPDLVIACVREALAASEAAARGRDRTGRAIA